MNIKDLPQGSYQEVSNAPLNINNLQPGDYQDTNLPLLPSNSSSNLEEQPSVFSNNTMVGRGINNATKIGKGASDFMFGSTSKNVGNLLGSGYESAKELITGKPSARNFIDETGLPREKTTALDVAGQALETLPYTKLWAPMTKVVGKAVTSPFKWASNQLYKSALKPANITKAGKVITSGDDIAKFGLKENVWLRGDVAAKISSKFDDVMSGLDEVINNSKKTIKTKDVVAYLDDAKKFFANQVDVDGADDAIAAIDKLGSRFTEKYGTNIPIKLAQRIKVDTGTLLRKTYGQLTTASTEGQKSMVRGLKELIVKNIPKAGDANAKLQGLMNLEKAAVKAVNRSTNKNVIGMGLKMGASAGGTVGRTVAGILADLADSAALKSGAAIVLNKAADATVKAGTKASVPASILLANFLKLLKPTNKQ